MKQIKTLIAIFLILVIGLSLVACGVSGKFTGTWRGKTETEEDCVLTIKSNKAFILQVSDNSPITGKVEELDSTTIILTFSGLGGDSTITCSRSGNSMHIKGSFTWKSADLQKN